MQDEDLRQWVWVYYPPSILCKEDEEQESSRAVHHMLEIIIPELFLPGWSE